MSKRLVCICNMVSEKEILEALKKGAVDTSEVQRETRAGTSCGKCLILIDHLVDEYHMQEALASERRTADNGNYRLEF